MAEDKKKEPKKKDGLMMEQIPLPLEIFTPNEVVRPEYNIGKFAGIIFVSPYSKNIREERSYEWNIKLGEESMKASLSVVPSLGKKTPTTTTLRVYLALLQVWEYQCKPEDGEIRFSARQLCEVIGWRWGGKETAGRISEHLKILSGTRLNWLFSYYNANGELEEQNSDVSILQTTNYRNKETIQKSKQFTALQRVRFNSDLVDNMLRGHVRPLNYHQFQRISNDSTANLYARIDLYLSKKRKWERRSLPLFREELGLVGKRYDARRLRLQRLKKLVQELNGVELLHGKLVLSIEKTADGADWKLVARKEPRIRPQKRKFKRIKGEDEANALTEEIIEEITLKDKKSVPHKGYILFLCRTYPSTLIRRALANAKVDYRGKIKKTLVHVFAHEVKLLVLQNKNLTWHNTREKTKK